jgi:hypothetical protein
VVLVKQPYTLNDVKKDLEKIQAGVARIENELLETPDPERLIGCKESIYSVNTNSNEWDSGRAYYSEGEGMRLFLSSTKHLSSLWSVYKHIYRGCCMICSK